LFYKDGYHGWRTGQGSRTQFSKWITERPSHTNLLSFGSMISERILM